MLTHVEEAEHEAAAADAADASRAADSVTAPPSSAEAVSTVLHGQACVGAPTALPPDSSAPSASFKATMAHWLATGRWRAVTEPGGADVSLPCAPAAPFVHPGGDQLAACQTEGVQGASQAPCQVAIILHRTVSSKTACDPASLQLSEGLQSAADVAVAVWCTCTISGEVRWHAYACVHAEGLRQSCHGDARASIPVLQL